MTNQEWKNLIAKEFRVSNSVAKGMLHAIYQAKKCLDDVPRQREKERELEHAFRLGMQYGYGINHENIREEEDAAVAEFMAQHRND